MTIVPNFIDGNNWNSLGELSGVVEIVNGNWRYINKLYFSQLLSSTTLLIFSTSRNARPTWNYAGNANLTARNTVAAGAGSLYNVVLASRSIYLGFSILRFPEFGLPEYGLEVFVPKWFNIVDYQLWEYVGDGVPSLEGKLDAIYNELVQV